MAQAPPAALLITAPEPTVAGADERAHAAACPVALPPGDEQPRGSTPGVTQRRRPIGDSGSLGQGDRRRRLRTVRRLLPMVALAAIVLGLAGCGSATTDADVGATVKRVGGAYDDMATSARPFDRAMAVGQAVVVTDKGDVTLQSVSRDAQGWPAPGAGKELIVLELTLVNRSGTDLNLTPLTQLQLTDLANNLYPALEARGFEPLSGGSHALAPAGSTRGLVAFAIPTGSRHVGLVWSLLAPAVLIIGGLEAG